MKIAALIIAFVGGCAACETASPGSDTELNGTIGGYEMGNLPVSRTATLVPGDPVPPNLLNELQDNLVALNVELSGGIQTLWPANPTLAGDLTVTRNLIVGGFASVNGILNGPHTVAVITPTLASGNNNNFNPTGLSSAIAVMCGAGAAATITGMAGGVNGRIVHLLNVSGFTVSITNNDTNSTASNRFVTPGAATLTLTGSSNHGTTWIYDGASSVWRLLAKTF